jgi:hypothetical protein
LPEPGLPPAFRELHPIKPLRPAMRRNRVSTVPKFIVIALFWGVILYFLPTSRPSNLTILSIIRTLLSSELSMQERSPGFLVTPKV